MQLYWRRLKSRPVVGKNPSTAICEANADFWELEKGPNLSSPLEVDVYHNGGQLSVVILKIVAPNLGPDGVAAFLAVVAGLMSFQGQRIDHSPVTEKDHIGVHTTSASYKWS